MPDFRTEYQKIYEVIRQAIIAGEFAPGERLPQRKLAEKYKTTTITVREALRFLENDGLILIEPKWGAMVVELTPEIIHGRYVVREALEGMAARLAAQTVTDGDKEELMDLAVRCDRELLADRFSRQEKANLHYSLHEKIVQITGCDELIRSTNRNNLQTILMSNAYHIDWSHDDPERHRKLIKAIISSDPDLAEAVMREHVRGGYIMELKTLSAPVQTFGN